MRFGHDRVSGQSTELRFAEILLWTLTSFDASKNAFAKILISLVHLIGGNC